MTYQEIAKLALTGQSLAIAGNAFPRTSRSKKKKKKIIPTAVETIVGTSMLRASAHNVGSL